MGQIILSLKTARIAMLLFSFIVVVLSSIMTVGSQVATTKKVVCYYMFVAEYRKGDAKLSPDGVDPYLCTHIIFAFPDPKVISPFPEPDNHMASE